MAESPDTPNVAMTTCPECNGQGWYVHRYGPDNNVEQLQCETCGGTGDVPYTPNVAERTHPVLDGTPVMIGDVLVAPHPDDTDPEGNTLEVEFHVGSMFWDSGHDVDYSTGKPVWPSRPRGWTVAPIDEEADCDLPYEWPLSECRRPDTPSVCPRCGQAFPAVVRLSPTTAEPITCAHPWHDGPATPTAPGSSSPDVTALADELRNAILDIDAHATPFGTDDDGFVSGGYLISVGSLHRALGVVGHSAAKCGGCRNCWTLDQWKAEEQLLRDELEAQAARITELEQFLIRLGHNLDRLDLP